MSTTSDEPSLFDELAAILKAEGLDHPQKSLLHAIHSRAGNGRRVCTASAATLAADIGENQVEGKASARLKTEEARAEARAKRLEAGARNVRNWIKILRDAGWIADADGRKPHDPRPKIVMGPKFRAAAVQEAESRRREVGQNRPSRPDQLGTAIPSSTPGNSESPCSQLGTATSGTRKPHVGNSESPFLQTTPESSQRTTKEPSVSQSGETDGLTDSSSISEGEESGGDDRMEHGLPIAYSWFIIGLCETLEHLPDSIRTAVEAPRFWEDVRKDWRRTAVALVKIANRVQLGKLPKIVEPESYLASVIKDVGPKGEKGTADHHGKLRRCMAGEDRVFRRDEDGRYVRLTPTGPVFKTPDPSRIYHPNSEAYRTHVAGPDAPRVPSQMGKPMPFHRAKPEDVPAPKLHREPADLNTIDDAIIASDVGTLTQWVRKRYDDLKDDESPGAKIMAEIQAQGERLKIQAKQQERRATIANRALDEISKAAAAV